MKGSTDCITKTGGSKHEGSSDRTTGASTGMGNGISTGMGDG